MRTSVGIVAFAAFLTLLVTAGSGVYSGFYPSEQPSPLIFVPVFFVAFLWAGFCGFVLSKRVGFGGLPVIESTLSRQHESAKGNLKSAGTWGLLVGATAAAFSLVCGQAILALMSSSISVPPLDSQTVLFGLQAGTLGGFLEEALFRLGILTFFAWSLSLILKRRVVSGAMALVLSTLAWVSFHDVNPFALMSAPLAAQIRIFQLIVVGMALGLLYVRKGYESVVLAHFVTDFLIAIIAAAVL